MLPERSMPIYSAPVCFTSVSEYSAGGRSAQLISSGTGSSRLSSVLPVSSCTAFMPIVPFTV